MTADFQQVDGFQDLFVGRLKKLSCTAFRMRDGSICLYSPIAGLETAFAHYQSELGEVTALLAPNHYHNKGLNAHIELFPNAMLYCSSAARPRLSKITGLTFSSLDRLREKLPEGSDLHEPAGLKTGEVWLQVSSTKECALAVTDAFSAALLPLGAHADCASLLGTFPSYGIKDTGSYKTWATQFLTATAPSILLPCHGSPVKSVDLIAQLIDLIEREI